MDFNNMPDLMNHYILEKNLIHNNKEALLLAYSFLVTPEFYMPECSFLNERPTQHRTEYVLPADMFTKTYGGKNGLKVPSWAEFYEANKDFKTAIQLVSGCNHKDTERCTLPIYAFNSFFATSLPLNILQSPMINFTKSVSSNRVDKYCNDILNTYITFLKKI